MNADNHVTPGAPGPYAHPANGVPVQAQAGQAAPAAPQSYQQVVAPSAPHPQSGHATAAAPVPATPVQHSGTQAQHSGTQAQHSGTHAQPTGAWAGAPAVSGSAPVRASLRKDGEGSGTLEQGSEERGGVLGFMARLIRRGKPEVDEGLTGSRKLKKNVGPRRVRAMLTTVDPWSIMKLAFLLSIAAGIMFVVATAIVWNVLNQMGVFASINEQITTILGPESKTTFLQFTDRNKIMSVVILLSVINSILMTGLATIGAFLYNLIVRLVGGVYITLTDE